MHSRNSKQTNMIVNDIHTVGKGIIVNDIHTVGKDVIVNKFYVDHNRFNLITLKLNSVGIH